jgi:hypothetical protein
MIDNDHAASCINDAVHCLDVKLTGPYGYLGRIGGHAHPDCMSARYLEKAEERLRQMHEQVRAARLALIGNAREAA